MKDEQTQLLMEIRDLLKALAATVGGYIVKAEAEVPEHLRRHMMYYHDILHVKGEWQAMGMDVEPEMKAEIERTHHRLMELIEEESNQGGTFHPHIKRFAKDGRQMNAKNRGLT